MPWGTCVYRSVKSAFALALPIFAILANSALLSAQTAGSIQGAVTDAGNGRSVAGAFVTAIRSGLPPQSQIAVSSTTGAFLIDNLAAGTYKLCVQVPQGGYLDPCQWQTSPPTVTLAAGQNSGNAIKLQAGSTLHVRLNDPTGLGASAAAPAVGFSATPPVILSVRAALGLAIPLTMISKDASGTDHEVTIPFDSPVAFQIFSGKLALAQADGTALGAAGAATQVTHSSTGASPPAQLVFLKVGAKP